MTTNNIGSITNDAVMAEEYKQFLAFKAMMNKSASQQGFVAPAAENVAVEKESTSKPLSNGRYPGNNFPMPAAKDLTMETPVIDVARHLIEVGVCYNKPYPKEGEFTRSLISTAKQIPAANGAKISFADAMRLRLGITASEDPNNERLKAEMQKICVPGGIQQFPISGGFLTMLWEDAKGKGEKNSLKVMEGGKLPF